MEFFDMNVPYYESDRNITDKERVSRKATRLKLVVKAMELGYGGLAYNRILKGVMSDLDRCSIPLFPLSSLTKAAPSISSAVKLHREVLGLPLAAPFRQYTRLTVVVESSSQALALNSGNPVLKSYDIIAVRPMNQSAFEQACQTSEVDMISINFSDKMPFRLKHPMVKAAIQRGVYFEITYSGLIMDAQTRRQLISNAKLLVDWTRGKNLIISSAAPSVCEMRGPYDIANLSSLLGLPLERAKAALSKNCRSLLTRAIRKRQYYKEAIRVELIPSTVDSDETKKKQLNEWWMNWDPISSGDGDLLLDDIAKSFSVSNSVSKTVKGIDIGSVTNNVASGIEHPSPVCEENNQDGLNSKPMMDCAKSVTDTSTNAQISFPCSNLTDVEAASHVLEDTKMIPDASLGLEDDKMEEDMILTATDMDEELSQREHNTITKEANTNVGSRPSIPESSAEEHRMETTESKEMDMAVMRDSTYNEDHDSVKEMGMAVMGEPTHNEDHDSVKEMAVMGEPTHNEDHDSVKEMEMDMAVIGEPTDNEDHDSVKEMDMAVMGKPTYDEDHYSVKQMDMAVMGEPTYNEDHGSVKQMDMAVMEELTYNEDDDSVNPELATTTEQKKIENQNESNSTKKFDKFPGKIRLKARKGGDRGMLFPLRRLLLPINFKRKARKSKTVDVTS